MIKRTSILLFIFLLSIFSIKAQEYFIYEYYEVTARGSGYTGAHNIPTYFGGLTTHYVEYTFLYYDISILNDYYQMNNNINLSIYDIKPENHTNDYFQGFYIHPRRYGYKLVYENGEYKKYISYSKDRLPEENPIAPSTHYITTDIGKKVYRKRTFNNETEYINYLSIMDINPLPIELLYFNARYDNDMIIIKWSTGSETNNDYFNIEASNDGYIWNDILHIKGQGNISIQSNYEYDIPVYKLDYKRGEPIYVRLKQTDYNGEYKTYEPRSLLINYEPNYIFYNLEGRVYDNEYDIPPNTIYIKKELTTGETKKIIKTIYLLYL